MVGWEHTWVELVVERGLGSSLVVHVHGASFKNQARASHGKYTASSSDRRRSLTQGKTRMEYVGHTHTFKTRRGQTGLLQWILSLFPMRLDHRGALRYGG